MCVIEGDRYRVFVCVCVCEREIYLDTEIENEREAERNGEKERLVFHEEHHRYDSKQAYLHFNLLHSR